MGGIIGYHWDLAKLHCIRTTMTYGELGYWCVSMNGSFELVFIVWKTDCNGTYALHENRMDGACWCHFQWTYTL